VLPVAEVDEELPLAEEEGAELGAEEEAPGLTLVACRRTGTMEPVGRAPVGAGAVALTPVALTPVMLKGTNVDRVIAAPRVVVNR
jgi:hypothetical protein